MGLYLKQVKFLIFASVLLIQGCFFASNQRLNISEITNSQAIFDIRQKNEIKQINFSQLIKQLLVTQTVLIGEKHTNDNHHLAQLAIVKNLIAKISPQIQASIVFEMLSTNTQNLIDTLQERISQGEVFKPSEIPALIDWDKGWDYAAYQELIVYTLQSPYKLVAGNLSREEIKTIINGAMPLNGYKSTALDVQQKLRDIIASSHKIDSKETILTKLVSAQQFKDRRMAQSLLKTPFSVLIAGRFHVSNTIGVPLHLHDLFANRKVLSVILLEGDIKTRQELLSQTDFDINEADFVWILPRSN